MVQSQAARPGAFCSERKMDCKARRWLDCPRACLVRRQNFIPPNAWVLRDGLLDVCSCRAFHRHDCRGAESVHPVQSPPGGARLTVAARTGHPAAPPRRPPGLDRRPLRSVRQPGGGERLRRLGNPQLHSARALRLYRPGVPLRTGHGPAEREWKMVPRRPRSRRTRSPGLSSRFPTDRHRPRRQFSRGLASGRIWWTQL